MSTPLPPALPPPDPALGRPVLALDRVDSTNRIGRQLARAWLDAGGLGPLPVVVADHQTAGRGRQGRSWQAEPGQNLLFTVLLAPDLPLARAPRAVLEWAAAMAEALDLGLKWPNDLVDDHDRKVAGVLAEHEPGARGDRVGVIVLGVGLNVRQRDFPGLPGATSLALLGRPELDRDALLHALVRAVDGVAVGTDGALDRWRTRSRTLGRRVRVAGREGLATGLRDDGALLVDGAPVLAGDVELVAGPDATG
ncbi:MAG: biotin--[acetyl-CoA-carboxylase] ligase [Alphaproteobacteria bacterium]|nr:biotin--[acetyl-CoA-carboxylase] ligase [Alphaproteobacteria bacterium]